MQHPTDFPFTLGELLRLGIAVQPGGDGQC